MKANFVIPANAGTQAFNQRTRGKSGPNFMGMTEERKSARPFSGCPESPSASALCWPMMIFHLTLQRGEILGLLGENGAGKTTLMNILFGHYVADAGTIEVQGIILPPGQPAAALAAGIGMVHQHFTLAENLTVLDNIVLGTKSLWRLSSNSQKARIRIRHLAQEFGLKVNPDAIVSALSVGERQRVEILKALYREAKILVLDEPTAVLTPQESAALFETLKRFVGKGLSIIFISHKLGEILAACNRVSVLRGGSWWLNGALQGPRGPNLPS